MYVGQSELHAGVVHQIAGGEVVRAVDDDVEAGEDLLHVAAVEPGLEAFHFHAWIERFQGLPGGSYLGHADTCIGVQNLPLQVAAVHHVVVHQSERADPCRGKIECGRGTQPTGADQQDLAVREFDLPGFADFGHHQVARVALARVLVEPGRNLERQAFVLPAREAAGHGIEMLVAEPFDVLGGEQGAHAAVAHQHQRPIEIRHRVLDA